MLRRNCLLKHVIEGKIEERIKMTERRGRRCRQLLDGVKGTSTYWILKEETPDLILRRSGFGRGHGHVVRQTN
jgi:hypothetical protein